MCNYTVASKQEDMCNYTVAIKQEVVEEGFPHLKFLRLKYSQIRYWRATSDYFPFLEQLFLVHCWCLDSIPHDFAEITTLKIIY
ncbi:hypothetical protein H5410_059303, partial [Solanum commersonii]